MTLTEHDLLTVEFLILTHENPDYLEVSMIDGWLYVLSSKRDYKHYKLEERYHFIYQLLKSTAPEIINKVPVLIETLTDENLTDLMKMYRPNRFNENV